MSRGTSNAGDLRRERSDVALDDGARAQTVFGDLDCASAGSSEEVLASDAAIVADVALLDLALGAQSLTGVELGLSLRQMNENIGIVIYSQHVIPDYVRSMQEHLSQAWSFVEKSSDTDFDGLVRILKQTAAGKSITQASAKRPESAGDRARQMTDRQHEIMALGGAGTGCSCDRWNGWVSLPSRCARTSAASTKSWSQIPHRGRTFEQARCCATCAKCASGSAMPTLSDAVTGAKGRVLAFVNIVLGPWPIRTVPLALFAIAAISFSQTTLGVDEVLAGGARRVWFTQIPRTILIAGLIVLPLVVSEFVRHSLVKRPLTRGWYLISLAIASLIYPFIMFSFFATQPWSVSQDFDLLGLVIVSLVRSDVGGLRHPGVQPTSTRS